MQRNLELDSKANRFKLPEECESHSSIYWYWSNQLALKKQEVLDLKSDLKDERSAKRLELLDKNKNKVNTINKDLLETLQNEVETITIKLKRAEATAYNNAIKASVTSAMGKEKDPTAKDIQASIDTDADVIELQDELLNKKYELKPLVENYNNSNKDPTAKDLDALVDADETVKEIEKDLLEAQKKEILYSTAVDVMDKKRRMLENLVKMSLSELYSDPDGKHKEKDYKQKHKPKLSKEG